jgi:hypothetical protein
VRFVVLAVVVIAAVAIFLTSPVFQPAPAKERLAGVSVALDGYQITDLGEDKHEIRLDLEVISDRDLDTCLGFALDEPFRTRHLKPSDPAVDCLRPASGSTPASVEFDGLTDIDFMSSAHTLVWGVDGGRCNLLMQAFGFCVVEQAGTVPVELPPPPGLPSFPPIGSLPPIFQPFSFDPP